MNFKTAAVLVMNIQTAHLQQLKQLVIAITGQQTVDSSFVHKTKNDI